MKKAIILSAGQGSRLGHLTDDRPKCLIEFNGRTLLDRQLDALAANGIEEVVVVTGFRNKIIVFANRIREDRPHAKGAVLLEEHLLHDLAQSTSSGTCSGNDTSAWSPPRSMVCNAPR